MIAGRKVLGVIPARGGSKRCPRKNLRVFRGKSLIQWAIETAAKSIYLDKVVLSTEDEEIKAEAINLKCEVLDRPNYLATDDATTEDVLRHAMQTFPEYDWVVLLQPTSPLRTGRDIDEGIERAQKPGTCISYGPDGAKNGAVYVAHAEWIKAHNFSDHLDGHYTMPRERSLDIDWDKDFEIPQNGPRLSWDG